MGSHEKISLNGEITTWQEAALNPSSLLGRNWVYTTINTYRYRPLALAEKLAYASASCKKLFDLKPEVTPHKLASEIHDLLYFGLYPESGNTLNIYFIPSSSGTIDRLIIHEATTPYEGYALLSIRPTTTIANYELPFEAHHTNVSMTSARFADNYASSRGYTTALRANRAGTLLSSGDNPLFAVRGQELVTTPISAGARPSVEREQMMRVANAAGVRVVEEPLQVEDLEQYEELMVFTPVGIQSISSVGEIKLVNIYAKLLSSHLGILNK